jgi:hypothetical protein
VEGRGGRRGQDHGAATPPRVARGCAGGGRVTIDELFTITTLGCSVFGWRVNRAQVAVFQLCYMFRSKNSHFDFLFGKWNKSMT